MTDKQIIKAWEKVLNNSDEPIGEHWMVFVTTQIAKETFDMLNRQNAEIEELKAKISVRDKLLDIADRKLEGTEKACQNYRVLYNEKVCLYEKQKAEIEHQQFKIYNLEQANKELAIQLESMRISANSYKYLYEKNAKGESE